MSSVGWKINSPNSQRLPSKHWKPKKKLGPEFSLESTTFIPKRVNILKSYGLLAFHAAGTLTDDGLFQNLARVSGGSRRRRRRKRRLGKGAGKQEGIIRPGRTIELCASKVRRFEWATRRRSASYY